MYIYLLILSKLFYVFQSFSYFSRYISLVLQQKTRTGINKPCKFNIYKEFFCQIFIFFLLFALFYGIIYLVMKCVFKKR